MLAAGPCMRLHATCNEVADTIALCEFSGDLFISVSKQSSPVQPVCRIRHGMCVADHETREKCRHLTGRKLHTMTISFIRWKTWRAIPAMYILRSHTALFREMPPLWNIVVFFFFSIYSWAYKSISSRVPANASLIWAIQRRIAGIRVFCIFPIDYPGPM